MIDPKKISKAKVPEMLEPNIKPDAPNTQPGDVGNGHVLVIDARTQRFNGVRYRLQQSGLYIRRVKNINRSLHIDVWEYHNGVRPEGYLIHHDHRNPDGSFDKNENNIEWLKLMTRDYHSAYHRLNSPVVTRVCVQCGKEFETNNIRQKYCCKSCSRKHGRDNEMLTLVCPVCQKHFHVYRGDQRLTCSDECEAKFQSSRLPAVVASSPNLPTLDKGYGATLLVTRICPICSRTFLTRRTARTIACSHECGKIVSKVSLAHRHAMEEQMQWDGKFMKLINKTLGADIRTRMIDGEPWFVAKDVCDALELQNSRQAVSRLDEDDKRIINVANDSVILNDGSSKSGNPNMTFINESGLYRLIFESRKPEAIEFKRWITHEVLPMLRKYNKYVMDEEAAISDTTDEARQLLDDYRSLSDSDRQLVNFIITRNRA